MKNCGNCANGKMHPQDVRQRICKGVPPQIIPVMTAKGPSTQNMFPLMNAEDEGCGMHKAKVVLDTVEGNA